MMKDYRRMMERVTLSDQKKEEIMDMLENKDTQKRRMPRARALILAAALAVGCVLSIAAGLPAQVYHFLSGGSVSVMPAPWGDKIGGGEIIIAVPDPEDAPLVLEDGRLWFVNSGERTDVTDQIDENTPYIYEHTDPVSGYKGWLILGGTPEDFGWAEYTDVGGGGGITGRNFGKIYLILDGQQYLVDELTDEQRALLKEMDNVPTQEVHPNWLVAAMEQLGIEHY